MNVFIVVAIVLFVLAIAAGAIAWNSRRRQLRLTNTQTSSVSQLAPSDGRELVEVKGVGQPGPRGLLKAPISGTQCIWYEATVTREYQDERRQADGSTETTQKSEVVSEQQSNDPFGLRDATGVALIQPSGSIDGATKSASEYRQPDGMNFQLGSLNLNLPSGERYRYEEWTVRPGTQLFIQGATQLVGNQLMIGNPAGPKGMLMSTRSEEQLLGSAQTLFRVTGIIAGVLLLAAIVLLIVGLLR